MNVPESRNRQCLPKIVNNSRSVVPIIFPLKSIVVLDGGLFAWVTATALRFWLMRKHVDRRLLLSFGVMSAAGGLVHEARTDYAMLLGLLFLLIVGAGRWSCDARMGRKAQL